VPPAAIVDLLLDFDAPDCMRSGLRHLLLVRVFHLDQLGERLLMSGTGRTSVLDGAGWLPASSPALVPAAQPWQIYHEGAASDGPLTNW
jgi:hypothetical protein